jgi:calcium-dependent protein kinase
LNFSVRDLKLENFIFETVSRDSNLKLIDFGLSKYLDESELLGALVGTPYYIAPEVWNDKYDEKCDHWALGVCAYTLLLGEFPFDATSVDDLKLKIKYSEPSYAHLRPTTESFLRVLLNKNPSERAEFAECFEHPFMARSKVVSTSNDQEPNSVRFFLPTRLL